MFGRDPDAAGYDNWVNELNNGMSRNTVVDTLLESDIGVQTGVGSTSAQIVISAHSSSFPMWAGT